MEALDIKEDHLGEVVVLSLRGLIDSGTSLMLEDRFRSLAAASDVRVVVDLREVDYISSAGWGIFVGEIKGFRERSGDIKLAGMRPDVRDVFDLLEFNTLLEPHESTEDAVAAFGEGDGGTNGG